MNLKIASQRVSPVRGMHSRRSPVRGGLSSFGCGCSGPRCCGAADRGLGFMSRSLARGFVLPNVLSVGIHIRRARLQTCEKVEGSKKN